ncbi:MAG: YHS domain-containing protein [Kordiimonadaceae bacterium]|nr:YHS domain-containing protein [Kordiimonadaceae bacterium]
MNMVVKNLVLMLCATLLLSACGKTYITSDALVNANQGVAVQGYDVVAYQASAKPVKGAALFTVDHAGQRYHFSSDANRQTFIDMPEKYLPSYGGYCAYAMSLGRVVDIDPLSWAVVDGKLYLNANGFAHTLWSTNKRGNVSKADRKWDKMRAEAQIENSKKGP